MCTWLNIFPQMRYTGWKRHYTTKQPRYSLQDVMKNNVSRKKISLLANIWNFGLLPLYSLPDLNAIIPVIVVGNILFAVHSFGFDLLREAEGTVGQILHCFLHHLYMSSSTRSICLQEEQQDGNSRTLCSLCAKTGFTNLQETGYRMLVNLFSRRKPHLHTKYQMADIYWNCAFWLQGFHTSPMNHC